MKDIVRYRTIHKDECGAYFLIVFVDHSFGIYFTPWSDYKDALKEIKERVK